MLYKSGARVKPGTYWDIKQGERIDMTLDAVLPGAGDRLYIKASAATMVMAAPVVGLLFAVFLPFIGIAMAIGLFLRRVLDGAGNVMAKSRPFEWKPLEAYLSGRKKTEDAPKTYANVDEILEALNGGKRTGRDRNSRDPN